MRLNWTMKTAAMALALSAFAGAASGQSVYSFGDSLSDTGNVESVTFGLQAGSDTYYEGRFSNGLNWVDYLSLQISGEVQRTNPGLFGPYFASFSEGFNFAHGGAVTNYDGLNAEDALGFRPPQSIMRLTDPWVLTGQARHFRDQKRWFGGRAFKAGADDFATISTGGNDYLNGGGNPADVNASIVEAMGYIRDRGVRNFIVLDLPDLGEVPARFGDDNRAELNAITAEHNLALRAASSAFEAARDARVIIVPLSEMYAAVAEDADVYGGARFGFTNVRPGVGTRGNCLDDGLVLSACPDSYLFYDGLHPTRSAHDLIGRLAYSAVQSDAASILERPARQVAIVQTSAAQNRLVRARIGAARTGTLGSGVFSAGAGGASAQGGLGFQGYTGEADGGLKAFRYTDGAVPGLVEVTPDTQLEYDVTGASLRLNDGEYEMAYGVDGYVNDRLFLGVMALSSARHNTALQTAREDVSETFAVFGQWNGDVGDVGFSLQGGEISQDALRATGLAELPEVSGKTRTAHLTARAEIRQDFSATPGRLTGIVRTSVSQIDYAGYREQGGLALVQRTVPDAQVRGAALYTGIGSQFKRPIGQEWTAGLSLEAGGLVADSPEVGFVSLIDAPGLLGEQVEQRGIFAQAQEAAQAGALMRLGAEVARGSNASLSADFDALADETGTRTALSLRATMRF